MRTGRSVDAESLADGAKRTRYGAGQTLTTHEHVGAFRGQRDQNPRTYACAVCACGETAIRLLLRSVDQVRKFNSVLDKEDWNIVANQVPIAFLCVEFDGEPPDIAELDQKNRHFHGHGRESRTNTGVFSPTLLRIPAFENFCRESVSSK